MLVQSHNPESGLGVPPPPPGAGLGVALVVAVAVAAAGGNEPTLAPSEEGGIAADPTADSNRDGPQA